jgi:hypothetical protein
MSKRRPPEIDRSQCSSPYNHDWQEFESQRNPDGGGWYLTMRCTKCTTIFRQIINPDGSIEKNRRYTYAPGYRESNAGLTRAEFRVKYLKGV